MRLSSHVVVGVVASVALYPAMGMNVAAFFAASVLIDIDHYIDYVYHNGFRDISPGRMFAYHDELVRYWREPEFLVIEVFHTAEFQLFVAAVVWLTGSALLEAVLWGMLFHIAFDTGYMALHSILTKRVYSFTEYLLRRRALKRRGLEPGDICRRAARMVSAQNAAARPGNKHQESQE